MRPRCPPPYTAARPAGDDYYLIRQLVKRDADHSGQTLQKPDYYVGAQHNITDMSISYEMREESLQILQNLADEGVLPQPWVDAAGDWAEDRFYADYFGNTYWLNAPYYSFDSLGFLTLTRFAMKDDGQLYTAFSLTVDSRTGSPVTVWISAPEEYEAPTADALRAWVRLVGLDTLGDWEVPANTPYQNALYSAQGELLATCAVHTTQVFYDQPDFRRGYISLALTPLAPDDLPAVTPDL